MFGYMRPWRDYFLFLGRTVLERAGKERECRQRAKSSIWELMARPRRDFVEPERFETCWNLTQPDAFKTVAGRARIEVESGIEDGRGVDDEGGSGIDNGIRVDDGRSKED